MQLLKPPLPRKPLQQQNNDTRSKGKNAKGTRANPPKKRNQEVLGDIEDEWEDTPGDSEEEEEFVKDNVGCLKRKYQSCSQL